MIHHT